MPTVSCLPHELESAYRPVPLLTVQLPAESSRAGRAVILTCVGGVYAPDTVAAIRLDPQIGTRIIGVDADGDSPQRHLVDEFYQVPLATLQPEAFVAALADVAERTGAALVLPGSDEEVYAI